MTPISSNFSMVAESGILLGDSLLGGRTHQHWCNSHALSVDRGNHEQDVIIAFGTRNRSERGIFGGRDCSCLPLARRPLRWPLES
jgi:hypothetical protein